jgi:hypothetical protein
VAWRGACGRWASTWPPAASTAEQRLALSELIAAAEADGALTWAQVFRGRGPPPYRPGPLSAAAVAQYWRDGWAVVPVPADVDLAALRTEVADVVGRNAERLVSAGRLTPEQHAATVGADFSTRQALIETLVPGSSFEMFSRSCNGPDSPLNRTAPVRHMQSSPGMLAIVRQLIGATDIK